MANLLFAIDDSLLSSALLASANRNVALDFFIAEAIRSALEKPGLPLRNSVKIDDILQNALRIVQSKRRGERFFLKDICDAQDWERISGGERKSLGKSFRKAVESSNHPIARHVGRTSSNQAIYERV